MSDKTLREAAHLALAAMLYHVEKTPLTMQSYSAIQALREALAGPDEPANFCPRCGKRTNADLIHTCTPPGPVDHAKPLYAAPQPAIQGAKE